MPEASAFLFDIGNVIVELDIPRASAEIAARSSRVGADVFGQIDGLKSSMESGKISADAFILNAIQLLGFQGSTADFTASFQNMFTPNAAMISDIGTLADRLPLYLFSNTNALHVDYFLRRLPIFEVFRGAVYSHEVKAEKPDPAFYQAAIERYGLDPATTLYVDDLPENCATGRALGFRTHQYDFRQHGEFRAFLQSEGIAL